MSQWNCVECTNLGWRGSIQYIYRRRQPSVCTKWRSLKLTFGLNWLVSNHSSTILATAHSALHLAILICIISFFPSYSSQPHSAHTETNVPMLPLDEVLSQLKIERCFLKVVSFSSWLLEQLLWYLLTLQKHYTNAIRGETSTKKM